MKGKKIKDINNQQLLLKAGVKETRIKAVMDEGQQLCNKLLINGHS